VAAYSGATCTHTLTATARETNNRDSAAGAVMVSDAAWHKSSEYAGINIAVQSSQEGKPGQ